MRCPDKVLQTLNYKHVFFSVGYYVPSVNLKSWVTSQRKGPGALTITQQRVLTVNDKNTIVHILTYMEIKHPICGVNPLNCGKLVSPK